MEILLSEDGWTAFQILIQDGAYRLEQVTSQEDWQKEPEPVSLTPELEEPDQRHLFSLN